MHQITALLTNIRRVVKLYDSKLKPVCGQYGLAPIEATIISFLYNNPGIDTAADISDLRMLSKSNVSNAVENLIQKSLLQRRRDTEDRRVIHLSLTADAKPITQEIEKVRASFRKQIFQDFTPEEEALFIQMHNRLAENTKSAMKEEVPNE